MAAIGFPIESADAREGRIDLDVAAASLPEAIAELSRETGISIGIDGILPRLHVPHVHGRLTVGEALARLLANSDYAARRVGGAWRIERKTPPHPPPHRPPPIDVPSIVEPSTIVVVAAKRAQSLDRLPMAMSVVEIDETRRHDPLSDTTTIAGAIDGLSLTALGPGRNRMFLRGITDSAFNGESQAIVAVILDEARLTYSAPDPDIRLVDVDRIEVLKGPQGSLYGTGALGGIYQIVTRRADLEAASLDVAGGGELVSRGGLGPSGSVVANLPLDRGRIAVRLVGYFADEPGWLDSGARRNGNANRVAGARAGIGVDPGGHWRVDLTGFAQWLESRDSNYVYRPEGRSRPAQLSEPHDNDLRHISLRVARKTGGLALLLSSGITWQEFGDTYDAMQGALSFGLPDPQLFHDDRAYRVWDNEARINGTLGPSTWLLGISHIDATQSERSLLTGGSVPAALTVDDDHRTIADSAFFGELAMPIADRLTATAGARLYRTVVKERRQLVEELAHHEQRRRGVTPSLALAWRTRPGRLIFLRYGSAVRQGGLDFATTGQLEALKSDELAMIEAGWREIWAGQGRLEIGAYYAWWENMQADRLLANGLIETGNAGNARILGAELSLTQPLARDWRLELGATATHARLVRDTFDYPLEDRQLPVVPRYTVRGAIGHDFRLGRAPATLRLQMRYLGPARLNFDPELDREMGRVLESRMEGHVSLGRFDVAISIDNIFGGAADTFAFGNPLRFATMRQYTPQRPTTATILLRRHF